MPPVISVEHLSKIYHLGLIGTGTFSHDLEVWWAKMRGKPNPMLKIGETDHGNRDGEELWALRDVSFTVEQGEALGIIGRNGAGKSTLLKILSRVTAPTNGRVKVKGRIASLLEVGTGFHPELTGRENITLNGAILGMNKAEISRKFDEIVDFSGVEQFIDTPVKRYSSGMYVRLAFAVAAHLDPEILIVDEVLAVGDAEFQKKCLGKMSDVANEGRTVLFVSHNMGAVTRLCQRILLIGDGEILEDGTSEQVISKYLISNANISAFREWPVLDESPGDDVVRLRSVNATCANGQLMESYNITDEIHIQMAYDVLAAGKVLLPAIRVSNQEQIIVFQINDWDSKPKKQGRYTGSICIPGKFLAEGNYFVSVALSTPSNPLLKRVFEKDIVSFQINESQHNSNRLTVWSGSHPGVIRPDFPFMTMGPL